MNMSSEQNMEPGVVTRKMPQDNVEVWNDIKRAINDPETYIAENREESLEEARKYVDEQVNRRLTEDRPPSKRAQSLGHRIIAKLVGDSTSGGGSQP